MFSVGGTQGESHGAPGMGIHWTQKDSAPFWARLGSRKEPRIVPIAPTMPPRASYWPHPFLASCPPSPFPPTVSAPTLWGQKIKKEKTKSIFIFPAALIFPASSSPRLLPLPLCWCPPDLYLFLQKGTINPFFSSASKTFLSSPQLKICFPRGLLVFLFIFLITQPAPLASQLCVFIN